MNVSMEFIISATSEPAVEAGLKIATYPEVKF